MNWKNREILKLIQLGLHEDDARNDVTTNTLIAPARKVRAEICAKQHGVVAGLPLAQLFFQSLDPSIRFSTSLSDGATIHPGSVMAVVQGNARTVLSAERPALNALQHLSGIATFTAQQVKRLGASSKTKLFDTRKTLPGWRLLEKYAVRCGGGMNHRMSLGDAVLVKDNHLKICRLSGDDGGSRLLELRQQRPDLHIQVEIQTTQDLQEALVLKPHKVLLDNLSIPKLKTMIRRLRAAIPNVEIELSGGIKPRQLPALAKLGVERISMGCLTHSAPSFNCSLDITHVYPR
ncbi:MAG: carboxylating nicotinate-nucleotide diphosphorylase [Elusimicrobiota bacterium]|jgi:nicotinate-nucleotide pyrophosphorylase (carboxylating)